MSTSKVFLAAALAIAAVPAWPQASTEPDACAAVACREAAVRRVRMDSRRYTEVSFPRMPYAYNGAIYILVGESFFIGYHPTKDGLGEGKYQVGRRPDSQGLELRFWQEKDGSCILTVKNSLGRRIAYEAALQLPTEGRMHRTSVLPIEAGLTNYESWPHPVAQLVLFNIRYEDK